MKKLEVQGDVALRPSELPVGAIKTPHKPLALGEVSGHAHVIEACGTDKEAYDLFQDPATGKTFVAVGGDGAQMRHIKLHTGEKADHESIVLAPNTIYEVILQNEYNPEADAFQRVQD